MTLVLSLLLGCQQDLLLAGDVTGLKHLSMAVPVGAVPAPPPPPPPAVAAVAVAETPGSPDVVQGAEPVVASAEGAAEPGAAAPATPKFNPISVPEGPREGDGVRWEGVKSKGVTSPPPGTRINSARAGERLR